MEVWIEEGGERISSESSEVMCNLMALRERSTQEWFLLIFLLLLYETRHSKLSIDGKN